MMQLPLFLPSAWMDGGRDGWHCPNLQERGQGPGRAQPVPPWSRGWGRASSCLSSLPCAAARSSNVTINDIYHEVIKIYFQRPLGNGPRKTRQQTEAGGRQGRGHGQGMAVISHGAQAGSACHSRPREIDGSREGQRAARAQLGGCSGIPGLEHPGMRQPGWEGRARGIFVFR